MMLFCVKYPNMQLATVGASNSIQGRSYSSSGFPSRLAVAVKVPVFEIPGLNLMMVLQPLQADARNR